MPLSEVFNIDCMEGMAELSDKSINLLVTDPPYNTTNNEWDSSIDLPRLWLEWNRVVKDDGAMVFTTAQPFTTDLVNSNRKYFRYDLVWHKPLGSGFLNANKMPLRNHEIVIVFYRQLPTYNPQMGVGVNKKGVRRETRMSDNYGDFKSTGYFDDGGKRFPNSVISITNGNRSNIHPTQKPVDLFKYLIKTYSNKGDNVLDCYLGSGSSRIAAYDEGRNFTGFEIRKDYFEAQEKRFKQHTSQLTLI